MIPRSSQPLKRILISSIKPKRSPTHTTFRQPIAINNFHTSAHTALRTTTYKMSGKQEFSNADTGSKPADPYTKDNSQTDVSLADKVQDLSAFMKGCKYGMMCTRDASSGNLVSRCMALAAQENGGIDLLFHTNTESHKTDELNNDPHINISFLNSSGEWASINGIAEIVTDRSLVHKHYSQDLKAWLGDLGDGKHDGGPDDPRIGIIRVKTVTATYNVANKNYLARVAEVAQSSITGKTAVINKLREISEQEVKDWRAVNKA